MQPRLADQGDSGLKNTVPKSKGQMLVTGFPHCQQKRHQRVLRKCWVAQCRCSAWLTGKMGHFYRRNDASGDRFRPPLDYFTTASSV